MACGIVQLHKYVVWDDKMSHRSNLKAVMFVYQKDFSQLYIWEKANMSWKDNILS